MGNWFGTVQKSEQDIIEDFDFSHKFMEYQDRFEELNPSRSVHIDNDELIIETKVKNSYGIDKIFIDWNDPYIDKFIYGYLDKMYLTYSGGNKINYVFDNYDNIEARTDATDQDTIEEVSMFILESLDSDIDNMDQWLETYFDPTSQGYEILKVFGNDKSIDHIFNCEFSWYQYAWYNMLHHCTEDQCELVEIDDGFELYNGNGDSIVILSKVDNQWKYIGLNPKCIEYIKNLKSFHDI